jgi:hypothetical protein
MMVKVVLKEEVSSVRSILAYCRGGGIQSEVRLQNWLLPVVPL